MGRSLAARKSLAVAAGAAAAAALTGIPTQAPTALADDPVCGATVCGFLLPSRQGSCEINYGRGPDVPDSAYCTWTDRITAYSATLSPAGVLQSCANPVASVDSMCQSDPPLGQPTLAAGQRAAIGPFSCQADADTVTCTVVASGRGFTLSGAGMVPVR